MQGLCRIALLVLFTFPFFPRLMAQGVPVPPGVRAADQATRNSQASVPPPVYPQQKFNAAQVQQDSDELLALAQEVHAGTKQATQGLLPQDLNKKLKRIEKLSKRLQQELNP